MHDHSVTAGWCSGLPSAPPSPIECVNHIRATGSVKGHTHTTRRYTAAALLHRYLLINVTGFGTSQRPLHCSCLPHFYLLLTCLHPSTRARNTPISDFSLFGFGVVSRWFPRWCRWWSDPCTVLRPKSVGNILQAARWKGGRLVGKALLRQVDDEKETLITSTSR